MIKEGKVNKGGRNEKPSCPRPKNAPKGQGLKKDKTILTLGDCKFIYKYYDKGILRQIIHQ